jgi:SAM-dependent methyltransferase
MHESRHDRNVQPYKDRAWQQLAVIDDAYARGELDDAGWHRAIAAIIEPAYLRAASFEGGSGYSGTHEAWTHARSLIADGLARSGTFLDVGCANGLLMESIVAWGAARGLAIEPYGLDILPSLAERARARLPQWAERIFVGNALGWEPPQRFDHVRTGLEYVPGPRQRELVAWLLAHVVTPGGRLIFGTTNEARAEPELEPLLASWGYRIAGRSERPHRVRDVVYRVVWLDA